MLHFVSFYFLWLEIHITQTFMMKCLNFLLLIPVENNGNSSEAAKQASSPIPVLSGHENRNPSPKTNPNIRSFTSTREKPNRARAKHPSQIKQRTQRERMEMGTNQKVVEKSEQQRRRRGSCEREGPSRHKNGEAATVCGPKRRRPCGGSWEASETRSKSSTRWTPWKSSSGSNCVVVYRPPRLWLSLRSLRFFSWRRLRRHVEILRRAPPSWYSCRCSARRREGLQTWKCPAAKCRKVCSWILLFLFPFLYEKRIKKKQGTFENSVKKNTLLTVYDY